MTQSTWGYMGQVGEWYGDISIPPERQQPPLAAVLYLLEQVIPLLRGLHRPRQMFVSWGEYDDQDQEIAFHEYDEFEVPEWGAIAPQIERLAAAAARKVAVSSLFIHLDTAISDAEGESWAEDSAQFHVSIPPPELEPADAGMGYAAYIDVWCSTTYDEDYKPVANHAAAARNRPRLEAFLLDLATLLGPSFTVGKSQMYYFAITPTGFRDADDLPRRIPRR